MSETNTQAAPARGLKAGKLFRKEENGKSLGIHKKENQPFFSSTISRKEESAQDFFPGIQPQFIPGIHLSQEKDDIQAKCESCEEESKKLQRSPEPAQKVQMTCDTCAAEEKKEVQKKTEEETTPEKAPDDPTVLKSPIQLCPTCDHEAATVHPSLKVGAPDDPYEREADRMAEKVMRMPQMSFSGGGGVRPEANSNQQLQRNEEENSDIQTKTVPGLQRAADGGMQTSAGFTSKLKTGDSGTPLPTPVRQGMESAFQADFSPVKIHTGTEAASLSSEIGAQAFAYQNHIYFNENKYNPESSDGKFLLAHELTHTVQQGASKTVQRDPDDNPPAEESWLDKLKNKGFETVLQPILPAAIFEILKKIKNGGLLNYIKEILFDLFKTLFNKIGFSDEEIMIIIKIFVLLKNQLPVIIDGLSKGDCKPLFAALNLLSTVLGAIAGRVWDRLMEAIEPIRQWLLDIWNTYISPTIDKITAFAGEAWEKIKRFGKWLWDIFYQYIIKPYKDAWDWISKKLGIGDSDEPGVLGYVSDKLSEAWTSIKEELRPVIEPIQQVIDGIKSMIDMDAIRKFQEDAKKWLDEVVKTATAMGNDEDAVANKQLTLRDVLLPALNKAIDKLKQTITAAGDWLVEKVNYLTDKVNGFITGIQNNSYLSPVYSLISWIPKTIDSIHDWATDKVHFVFDKIVEGVEYLRQFIEPIITMLQKIVTVVGDLLGHLPDFILGVPFMFLPKCIKDPIIKWLTEVILKKIPLIAEFIELTEKWEQIKTAALTVIKQVFLDGQLGKGLWTFFKTLLDLLGIDPTLVTTVVAKAAQNFSDIISKPGEFLKNVWLVVKGGFKRFWDNILIHLPTGALNWLFGEVKGAVSVAAPPQPFTVGGVLKYVMTLFGITLENVYIRMEKNPRIGPKGVKEIKKYVNALTGALEWITVWIKDGPEGLLKKAKEKLDDIKNMVINGIVSWITAKVSAEIMKRLATSSDPLGIGATINTIILIYDTIKEAVAYANKLLNLANQAMDNLAEIIAGRVEPAEIAFEKVLAKAVPIVIGFAVEVIIGPVGDKIKEIVTDVRKVVDDAIDWLINGALNLIDSLINTAKNAIGAVMGWFGLEKEFTADNGESHHIKFSGSEENAVLMIASDEPLSFNEWIKGIKVEDATTEDEKEKVRENKQKAIKKHDEIKQEEKKKSPSTDQDKQDKFEEDKRLAITKLLDKLSVLLKPLFKGQLEDCADTVTNGRVKFSGLIYGYGVKMFADGLTKHKKPGGTSPNESITPPTYRTINQRRSGKGTGSYYVLGHLLNQQLGGTGDDMQNLTPLTRSANGLHESMIEGSVKTAVDKGLSVEYTVKPKYSGTINQSAITEVNKDKSKTKDERDAISEIIKEEANVPERLDIEAYYLKIISPQPRKTEKTLMKKDEVPNKIDQRPEAYDLVGIKRKDIYLDSGDADGINEIGSPMDLTLAKKIVEAMSKKSGRFGSFESLIAFEIDGKQFFTQNQQDKIADVHRNYEYVKLYKA